MNINDKNSVTLKIINSNRYTKLRPLRYSLYIICFLLFYSTIRPFGRPSITDYISIHNSIVYVLLLILILVAFCLYYYSKDYEVRGVMVLDTDHVSIGLKNQEPLLFSIADIKEFKISRGSTVHHEEDNAYPPETNDNWISFTFNSTDYKYEFSIETIEENREFERVINDLRGTYASFYYESI